MLKPFAKINLQLNTKELLGEPNDMAEMKLSDPYDLIWLVPT